MTIGVHVPPPAPGMPGAVSEGISARERALAYNYSSIFDVGGPSEKSIYDAANQKSVLGGEAAKREKKFEPQ